MTQLDLDELEKLANAASKGPWRRIYGDNGPGICGGWSAVKSESGEVCLPTSVLLEKEDGLFIAASRTAVPALIKECRALRAELTRLKVDAPRGLHRRAQGPGGKMTEAEIKKLAELWAEDKDQLWADEIHVVRRAYLDLLAQRDALMKVKEAAVENSYANDGRARPPSQVKLDSALAAYEEKYGGKT